MKPAKLGRGKLPLSFTQEKLNEAQSFKRHPRTQAFERKDPKFAGHHKSSNSHSPDESSSKTMLYWLPIIA